jgi:thiol-disulfide isomerase/thioredoxin
MLLLALSPASAAGDEKMQLGEFIPVTPPQPAPEVAFTDAAGKPASLGNFIGKPAVVNLWATWCGPCIKEMPSLDRLQAQFAGRLVVAPISEDHAGAKLVNPFVAKLNLMHLKVYLDPQNTVARALKVRGLPTSIVLDAKGRVVGEVEGAAEWDSPTMLGVLAPLVKSAAPSLEHAFNDRR